MRRSNLQTGRSVAVRLAFGALLLVACFLSLGVSLRAQTGDVPSRSNLGRHFIVLIDDSGSIAGRSQIGETDKRPAIKADLPGRLFGGIKGLQAFNPAQDRVSVLFFTILQNTSSCDKRKPRSALPENIFDLIYTGKLQGKDDFANKLAGWMSDDCHFNGNWSPIVISSLMALPFLQDKLPQGELHSQTILIQVTDAEFNAQAKPGHELTAYRQAGLADVAVVDQQLSRISRLFSLNVLPNQESLRGVFYLAAEYSSQRTPESAIQYQRNSLLYPQAVSSDEVRYRLNDQLLGDIQLLSQGKGSEFDFKPLWVRAGFQNSQGGDWRIGGTTLPRLSEKTKPASLNPCELPQCEVSKNSDRLGVGLFEAALGSPLKVSRSSADPEPGQIEFTVGFHYQTPIYDHLCVETPILLIKADPAQPAEIPNLFLPTSKLGKSDVAAEWEQDNDGVTTEEEAKNRVIARRNLHWLELAIFLIVLTGLVMTFLFLRYFRRRFQPRLNWLAAAEVVVDFNRPAASRLLVGTLQVENTEPVPWLGRLLRNDEQPSRPAKISLNYNYFKQSGLNLDDGNPIGFVRGGKTEGASAELDRATLESVSDGKQIYVFLAAEKFRDYQRLEASANGSDAHFAIPFKANLEWGQYRSEAVTRDSILNRFPRWVKTQITSERPGSFSEDFQSNLIVKPEEPRKPLVTYTPSNEAKLYFQKNARVQVGSFWFQSQALHEFAQPYRWEGYIIQTHQGNRPLSGEPIRLAEPVVEVPPWEQVEVPVYVYCDEQTITNPDPVSCEYSFRLLGDFSADSEPGPYTTTLYRDPKRADIELEIIQPRRRIEVYWTSDRTLKLRTMPDGGEVTDLIRDDGAIAIDQQTIKFDARHSSLRELLSFEIDNSGTAGRGVVEVDLTTHIRCDQAVESSIQLISGKRIDDMLGVYDFNIPQPKVVVREGERRQSRAVYLNPGIITRIVSARIEADRIAAEINLAIRVVDDEQAVTERTLTVVIPFSLEQLPSLNWLAIDFGTSAISAALGEGPGERVMMIPLQNISGEGGRSIAAYDVENVESDNENLLPSWICCNADLRDSSGDRSRPGFPGYYSPNLSMLPGEPDFIGLPAVTHEFEKYPGRIIYSLKSWLGRASTGIPIRIKENGNEIQKMLPLEKMVESGFAALAEAYLFEAEYHADQIVITHPNTFTPRHQDLLHGIAYRALGKPKRFGIPLKERVKLISESDAVAYHYCSEQMRGQPRAGDELLLVYDFGAGTLDLSLIKVVWKQDLPRYPLEWKVEKRLGVPLAGNYIDEVLARLIDTLLKDPNIVNPRNFKYVLPIVGRFLDKKNADQHQRAIIRLWHHIREAKHEWSRECRIVLDSGGSLADCPSLKVQVGAGYDLDVIQFVQGQRPDVEEPTDGPGLWLRDSGAIFLSIPARLIESDNRMSQFMDFVTEGVINEALASAGRNADEIDTVIVSGRGARYPELRERVWRHFRNAEMPLLENESMKNAVVLGAIARQGLSRVFEDTSDAAVLAPQLGVLLNYGHNLVLEKDWDKPIDLTASPTFRLVQVNLHAPNPPEDLKSLRKHFYIDLTDHEFVRDDILGDDKHLYVRKEVRDAELAIYLEGENGENRTPVFTEGQIAKTVTSAPWPIGHVLLDPQE